MINDFKPARRPAKSLRTSLDEQSEAQEDATETETFQTPEEVAAKQTLEASAESEQPVTTKTSEAGKKSALVPVSPSWRQKLALSWPPGKKEWISLAIMLVLIGVGSTGWLVTHHSTKAVSVATKIAAPAKIIPKAPTTVASTLSGLPVNPSVNKGPVTGVMIENSEFARPQSGLSQASVVFEAIAEGGITRFLALYQDTAPDNVGPIRSVRPYYEQWALGFDAALAHVGGSPEALADIKSWNVRDLDEFYNGSYYHRITTRQAPHNVYTAIATLNQLEAQKGYTSSTFTSFPRKSEAPSKQPTAATIHLTLSSSDYDVLYNYDASTNSYNRSEGGAPQIDANTNTQLSPKVVITMVIPYSLEADGYHSDYAVIGSGPVYVFQDGTVTTGRWTKSSNTSQIAFTNTSGKIIKLNPGQTWLTALAATTDVAYTP